jgi:hypothetical protein
MSTDMIRFDVLVQEALRGVVRKVLGEVARAGLPGEHHFYVTFDTTHPGVRVSTRVKARYPEEMTIVLQHQFWDLNVTEAGFDVGLSFGGIPEKLVIPFAAVKGFFDPSVQFGLQFEVAREASAEEGDDVRPADAPAEGPRLTPVAAAPARLDTARLDPPDDVVEVANPDEEAPDEAPQPSATVVSLDQFRKKT